MHFYLCLVCPEGFIFFDNDCYGFVMEQLNWEAANDRCNKISQGSSLATVESKKVNDFLMNQLDYKYAGFTLANFWIGLREVNGTLAWLDTDQYWMPKEFADFAVSLK